MNNGNDPAHIIEALEAAGRHMTTRADWYRLALLCLDQADVDITNAERTTKLALELGQKRMARRFQDEQELPMTFGDVL